MTEELQAERRFLERQLSRLQGEKRTAIHGRLLPADASRRYWEAVREIERVEARLQKLQLAENMRDYYSVPFDRHYSEYLPKKVTS